MPYINPTDKRTMFQGLAADANIPDPTFGETYAAGVGQVFDENTSISMMLNREGWERRKELMQQKIDEGAIDESRYQVWSGKFDYERAARELNDPNIKTDEQLHKERNEMLAQRRKYSNDVMERGSGMAQFLGSASAYMLDPISIATMPIALPTTGAKSLSILGRSLLTARNAAAIEAATELAIQPLVYAHKHDIDSPYTYKDALVSIGSAAIGGGVLGGVSGGLSGYLSKTRKAVDELGVKSPEVNTAMENIARLQESIDAGRASRVTPDDLLNDYDELLQGNFDSYQAASKNTIISLEKKAAAIRAENKTVKQFIQDKGGLNRELMLAEGFDPDAFKKGGAKPLFRKTGGRTPDEIAEALSEEGFRGGRISNSDVLDIVDDITRGGEDFISGDVKADFDYYKNQIDELSLRSDEEYLESVYKGARENDIQADIDFLEQLEVQRQKSKAPQTTPAQYEAAPQKKAASGTIGERERFIVDDAGLGDDFDLAMQKYNEIESPHIIQNDELVPANDFMKSIDDELEGIDSVLTCAYG